MTISADHARWGIATYVFSLDLAADLAALSVPGCPWDSVRSAARVAILENRAAVDAGHQPLLLRDSIASALGKVCTDSNRGGPYETFFYWVQTRFIYF